ncbi:proton-conducting transporter membrane subunit [Marivirga arenosa]|uniref:Probable inorganic carbon transporter subunit DabB n=1 Tax=Marivirga arenosa TaxID=3059076 RepID=A0AA51RAF9_9BACT|nr:proton-conducting transporter membrane subunit [Marivirga sp. ABR2-2]WMN06758.1 proton-conducting transporter membrane subunit [Marivirga sp. ABR2-2]
MQTNLYALVPLVAPLLLYGLAIMLLFKWKKPAKLLIETIGWLGIFISLTCAFVVYFLGSSQSMLLGSSGLGFAIRMDPLSITMLIMIALLGFIVLKYSLNYLDGDDRQNIFIARLATTIASVELLVIAGNIAQLFIFWVITSICLHYLLIFYKNRPQAVAAARKKFIVARIGDFSFLAACIILYLQFNTGNLELIFEKASAISNLNTALTSATILLVIAAVLKSAQFPTHGWLIEVVETPTPVSALLHAGLLNAGPFLMVRMAFLMNMSEPASLLLIFIGGFTAMIASVVFLTQPTVKIALGYSSVAHMGFMLLICGFGVYTAAILHLVAHSFYKAHAFLSSGSVIDTVKAKRVKLPSRKGSIGRIITSIMIAIVIYGLFSWIWGIKPDEEFALMATGAIIVMGLSQIIAPALDSSGGIKGIMKSAYLAFMVALAFFSLEKGAHYLLHSQIPTHYEPTMVIKMAVLSILILFALVVLLQLMAPNLKKGSFTYNLGIHIRNGLYANVIFDRLIGALKKDKFKWANLTVEEEQTEEQRSSEIKLSMESQR